MNSDYVKISLSKYKDLLRGHELNDLRKKDELFALCGGKTMMHIVTGGRAEKYLKEYRDDQIESLKESIDTQQVKHLELFEVSQKRLNELLAIRIELEELKESINNKPKKWWQRIFKTKTPIK